MAQVIISIDTADTSKSNIVIDGKKLKDVESVYVYNLGGEYGSIEIHQYESGNEDSDFRKHTILRAKANEQLQVDETVDIDRNLRSALAKVLLQREIK